MKAAVTRAAALLARRAAVLIAIACVGVAATAGENLTYSYDALGRLIKVSRAGTVNSNTSECYAYDPASNRSNVTVSTTSDCAAAPVPSFSISNASATEGGTVTFTVTRSGPTTGSYTVNYATAPNTATAGTDYTTSSGTLTFAAGVTTQQIQVTTLQDSAVEGSENFFVNLSAPSGGATITAGQGVGTIVDDDTAPSFSINNASATEGGTLAFTVTRSGPTTGSYTVNYATANNSATAGSDYTTSSGTLTFAAGVTTQQIQVTTLQDSSVEGDENFFVNLSGASGGATISDSQGVGTIHDDDSAPSFSISDASATEGGTVSLTVTRSAPTTGSYTVNYASANNTATAGSDYTAQSGTLSFASGVTSQTVQVATLQDSAVEGNETFFVNLSSPSGGATISDSQGIGTITDDDSTPVCSGVTFSDNNTTTTEGAAASFTVTKTGSATGSCSVSYATQDDTATAGSDYTATSGTLTFSSTQTSQTVQVPTIDDTTVENTEAFFLILSNPTNGAALGGYSGQATITDNDTGNRPPVAYPYNGTVSACGRTTVSVITDLGDYDPDGDTFSVTAVTNVTDGSASYSGTSVTFSTQVGSGTGSLSYTITDSHGASASNVMNFTISGGRCMAPAP